MAIFVNYYPCSYGDSLVSMFSNLGIQRENNLITTPVNYFKFTNFYNLPAEEKLEILKKLENNIYSCHRQNQFDFGKEYKVISILLDDINFLPGKFKSIHIDQLGKNFTNPVTLKLSNKLSLTELIKFDYQYWSKKNILSSDVVLPISLLRNNKEIQLFCKKNNLAYNQNCIDEIKKDMSKYQ